MSLNGTASGLEQAFDALVLFIQYLVVILNTVLEALGRSLVAVVVDARLQTRFVHIIRN